MSTVDERRRSIYVVCYGEHAKGHDPVAAYDTLKAARDYCEHTWGVRPLHTTGDWHMATRPNRVDEVWIRRMPVRGGRPVLDGPSADETASGDEIAAIKRRDDC